MPINNKNDDSDHTCEEIKDENGRVIKVRTFNRNGVLVSEAKKDKWGHNIEILDYNEAGELTERIVYAYDQFGKLLRLTDYDSKGNVKYVKEKGKRPKISE